MEKKIEEMGQKELINYINNVVNDELRQIRKRIVDENNERQFDFCTSPALATAVNNIEILTKDISDMVYQKNNYYKKRR